MTRLIPAAVIHNSQLGRLELHKTHYFASLAPFLGSLTHLNALRLYGCHLVRSETAEWPKPTFELRDLVLVFDVVDDELPPSISDFDWFVNSSRHSLTNLSLGKKCGTEMVEHISRSLPNLERRG